ERGGGVVGEDGDPLGAHLPLGRRPLVGVVGAEELAQPGGAERRVAPRAHHDGVAGRPGLVAVAEHPHRPGGVADGQLDGHPADPGGAVAPVGDGPPQAVVGEVERHGQVAEAGGARRERGAGGAVVDLGPDGPGGELHQSRQNSLPSGSAMTMWPAVSGGWGSKRRMRVAPSATSRSHSASRAAMRSSPSRPTATRTSRWTRFFATLPSGTRWKKRRGPRPSGSSTAERERRSSSGTPIRSRNSSQAASGSAPSASSTPGGPGWT